MINWIVEERKVSELKKWEINPRKISNKGSKELEKSLDKLGNFELLIVNSDNTVIAGNQRLEKFKAKGVDSIKVLVADRLLSEEEVKEIGLRSNLHKGTWDNDLLEMSFKDLIEQLGIDELIKGEEDGFYTRKIETPIYEPRGIEPNVNELIDTTKSDELLKKVEEAKIDEELKNFLRKAVARFYVFDYSKVADYFSNIEDVDTKKIFEDLALVIIDYDRAIENGFIEFVEEINQIQANDYDE